MHPPLPTPALVTMESATAFYPLAVMTAVVMLLLFFLDNPGARETAAATRARLGHNVIDVIEVTDPAPMAIAADSESARDRSPRGAQSLTTSLLQ